MTPRDWPTVREIYAQGISTENATFEREAPEWEAWDATHLPSCRLIADEGGQVVGWAALSAVSGRCVYAGVAEVSVYVAAQRRRGGIGKQLLRALVDESERNGIWTLQAGIFPENEASLAAHLACGFRIVGKRERLGQMNSHWRDVLLLERRSAVVGTETER